MKRGERFIVVTDTHGDMQDDKTVEGIYSFIADFRPTIRVHAGDAFDFRNLRKGASDEEKAESLEDDWDRGSELLTRVFEGGKKKFLLRGNHDERLWDVSRNCSGLVRDYASDGIKRIEALMKKSGAKMFPYDAAKGVLRLGKLKVVHGYHAGASACRQHAAVYGNCIFGHVHTIESAAVASLEPAEARSIGCACRDDMDYINKKTGKLRWGQGWAYGEVFEDGSYQLFQARKINGSFTVATEIKTYE